MLFAGDTRIEVNGYSFDNSKLNTIEYSLRLDDWTSLRIPYAVGLDPTATWRDLQLDIRLTRGGINVTLPTLRPVQGVVYIGIQEIHNPVGTLDYILAPGQNDVVTVGTTGISTDLFICANQAFSSPWIGIVADFKIFDAVGFLQNHWPIDDDVINGGTIVDVAGGQDGILTLGSGQWLDSPGLPP